MSGVYAKLTYKFELTAREFSQVRRALAAYDNKDARQLLTRIVAQANGSLETVKKHFETVVELQAMQEDEVPSE